MSIVIEGLHHVYDERGPGRREALCGIDLTIGDGELVGLAGPTGSGKSTLVQHFNGLLKPAAGRVVVDGIDLWEPGPEQHRRLAEARRRVGLVFQFPEQQLFEETVFADIAFAPRNQGLPDDEVDRRVREAMDLVGLPPELAERSPFALSGGQMRRVAIAGVLAMRPRTLVLDEPTAGLDPQGRAELLAHLRRLHREAGLTIVLVSHDMDELAALVERVILLRDGRVVADGPAAEVFARQDVLAACGLRPPAVAQLMGELHQRGVPVPPAVLSVDQAERALLAVADRLPLFRSSRPPATGGGRR
ncbi:MAG: energy-coupling factor transporter ATPase [Bacillota bacterium]|nr:MAG: energy-coupling factor transporter ATPase [Bacillota bacterium]